MNITGVTSNCNTYTGREINGIDYYRARYYNPQTGRFLSEDPLGFAGSGPNLYEYAGDNPINFNDPTGLATYVTNRQLAAVGDNALPWWDPISHTFTFSTNPDGSIAATYSWGNAANLTGWNLNQPEDMAAALQALQNGDAQLVAPSSMDPFYRQAFDQLNNPANNHTNLIVGRDCKTETTNLGIRARQLYYQDLLAQWWQQLFQQFY